MYHLRIDDWKKYLLLMLVVLNALVWLAVVSRRAGDEMKVYFFDVGQGDAIFIESPSGGRVLIDGGPTRKVVSELGKALPFGDRRIDVVIATHPDKDHIGGLPEVVSRFDIGAYIESGVESENTLDDELDQRIETEGAATLLAKNGMTVDFGDGARLTVLFPNTDVSSWETNDASIVARLDYGESSFLLTGDASLKTESILVSGAKEILDVDVLKAGHHGSRTSSLLFFVQEVTPEYTVISAGKDNSYGHPHKEVLDNLEKVGSAVFSTADLGTIIFETDGEELKVK